MKLLIVGGSGFVSGTLARQALAEGHEVWAITRGQRSIPDGITPIIANRKDRAAFASAVRKVDAHWDLVVDCIGYTAEDAQQDTEVFADRCDSFVFISTDSVYQERPRPFPVSESFTDFTQLSYGRNKRLAEELFIEKGGNLNWTILRPGHIYGPGSELGCLPEHGRDPQLLERLKKGEPIRLVGGGHFLQQPVFASDLARMILECAGNPFVHKQIFNSPGPDIIPSWRYYQIIAEHLGVELHTEEILISEHLKRDPRHLQFFSHRVYDTTKAKEAGLYRPDTPVEQGLELHVNAKLR